MVPLKEWEKRETRVEAERSGMRRGAALRVMLAARHGDAAVGSVCHARESSSAWTRGCRHERPSDAGAAHECVLRERRHNARGHERGCCWRKKCTQRQSHSKPNKAGFARAESK
jgi:hypothetical protein